MVEVISPAPASPGGSLSQMFVETSQVFVAGNGGVGVVGGAGGAILGNTTPGLITTNSADIQIVVQGGAGASGITGGGNGGGINTFVADLLPVVGVSGNVGGELINFTGGNAGNAVAGRAGTGGSITDSSPTSFDNNLNGDIYLQGGNGGSGLYGGGGGSINNFVNSSTIKDIPTSATFITGHGGNATLGTGGTGGSISGVQVTASGSDGFVYTFDVNNPDIIHNVLSGLVTVAPISYNRMVAGSGGSSEGGAGGTGGSISSIDSTSAAADASNVVAAGAGGNGLTAGGAGGSVLSVNADAGKFGKVLVIAGDGGSSYSQKVLQPGNATSIALSIGGVDGPGGNGGSILNFTQPTNLDTHVDLIAGNGGDTINHSFGAETAAYSALGLPSSASQDNSGRGGSLLNITVTGSIGNSDPNVAIKSYNNFFGGQTMQQFVDQYIVGNISAPMNDSIGNVGVVAGAAGYVEGTAVDPVTHIRQPAPGTLAPSSGGINGSVTNIHAQNIMSMVATGKVLTASTSSAASPITGARSTTTAASSARTRSPPSSIT